MSTAGLPADERHASVIVRPLFDASRGSILIAALFHFQVINPLWPDVQPYDTAFFALVASRSEASKRALPAPRNSARSTDPLSSASIDSNRAR